MNEAPAIEFRNVGLSFDSGFALTDVSFTLQRGEMIFITGNSASGKTVLLHLAIGLLRPDAGEIFIEGREIERLKEEELLRIRAASMGIVFQESSLFTGMSVYDNAAYRLDEQGWPEEKLDAAVREILQFVGLDKDADKLPEELSIGMGRRLEFARALVGWPRIMLFDEPTSGLDPINERMMLDLVIRARDIHKISSLYVTKELRELAYLAGHFAFQDGAGNVVIKERAIENAAEMRVMLLEEGRVAFTGTPVEFQLTTSPAVMRMTQP
ncbi:MAG TPA: ATP-binding cassette domain-containing protein [Blastocatellia bacterium]|nr:ATP-binding cassette domain-containing protein [Blastocatellia bacterium]